jgi:hypothetical protein
MAKERSKLEMIQKLQAERKRLEQNFSHLSHEQLLIPNVVGKWSIKDVLAHLAHWESKMPVWMEAARKGEDVSTPDEGLTWKQLNIFNERVYQAHRDQTLAEVLQYFHNTHHEFMAMVEAMPEDEMLTPGKYAFIGKGTVYDWLNAYAAHDRWAKTHIRKWMKTQAE